MKPIPRSYSRPRVGMPQFTLSNVCDECGQYRAHGNHKACSKKRQARYQSENRA